MTQLVLGIDVGGSSVKAGLVEVASGRLHGELIHAPTPQPSPPPALMAVIAGLAARLPGASGTVGIALPSVVKRASCAPRRTSTTPGSGTDGAALAARALGRPALLLNDADAAGIAEMRWGAGRDCNGTVIMVTSAPASARRCSAGGQLFPNTELGHLELHGVDAEKRASAQARTLEQLDFPAWVERVNEYLAAMHRLFWPDVFILGGAVSERFAEFAPLLRSQAELRAAHFANQAGVIGAALAAADERF